MKVLYISFFKDDSPATGGKVVSMRNRDAIISIYGIDNVIHYCIERTASTGNKFLWSLSQFISDVFNLQMNGLSNRHKSNILNIVKQNDLGLVFLDSSLLGQIAKDLKKKYPSLKIVSFFHNVEYLFCKQLFSQNKTIRNVYRPWVAKYNEKLALHYSDGTISLNKRDSDLILSIYNRKIGAIIPTSMNDSYTFYPPVTVSRPIKLLFIGSYFYANIEAIDFLIEKIMPFVDAHLTIVGSGLDKLQIKSQNISLFSNVPSLEPFFKEADAIVLPIFSGSGMKTKTCESMMFGKYIIGTNEAFEGYEINSEFAFVCNTSSEFIDAINSFDKQTNYSESSRQTYLSNYSTSIIRTIFSSFINSVL